MKPTVCLLLLIGLSTSPALAMSKVCIIDESPAHDAPIRHAMAALTRALQRHSIAVSPIAEPGEPQIILGVAGASRSLDAMSREHGFDQPTEPESVLIQRLAGAGPLRVVLAGGDGRGLMYAILEAAEAIRLAPPGGDPLESLGHARESPFLRTRSLTSQLFNTDVEREWFESEDYWHEFFDCLARSRYNNYTLTFGSQTNYRSPPFPWWFTLADFSQVRVDGLSAQEQAANLSRFRRITEIAAEHGVDFTLGLWTLVPMPADKEYGPSPIRDFPPAAQAPDYLAACLSRILRECPAIRGIQFRMNYESGIAEAQQPAAFQPIFAAIARCGRPVRVEMRYKGLAPATVAHARAVGLETTVSTKFWCEHLGLPFHPTEQEPRYSRDRYGYGAMLAHPRGERLIYQLWNVGTNRVLLWGDTAYAASFAESCRLGGGDGFEVFAPLSNKGFGDRPGAWRRFADRSYDDDAWEYRRYWMQLLAFGRLGYNPRTSAEVWRREFRARFGPAASAVEAAYHSASQVLPLLTVVRQQSASEWKFWPEMDPGGSLEAYAVTPPSDRSQFYAIARFRNVDAWRGDGWSDDLPGYVEDAVAGRLRGKWTPPQVSQWLDQLADETLAALTEARQKKPVDGAEWRATNLDLSVQAWLARFHAAKTRAATHLEFFRVTHDTARLQPALDSMRQAEAAWRRIVRLTDGVYHHDLVFGRARESAHYARQAGHWKDRLASVEEDVKRVAALVARHGPATQPCRRFAGESLPATPPRIAHQPVTHASPSDNVVIAAEVTSIAPLRSVRLHFRPMDQTQPWQTVNMAPVEGNRHQATISSKAITARFDMMYYLEACTDEGGTLWPDWRLGTPYIVIQVRRSPPTPTRPAANP